jgi:uncharacterized membrane protein
LSTEELLTFLHVLGGFVYVIGLTAVQVPLARAQRADGNAEKGQAIEEASHYQGVLLVPGAIAAAASGVFLWSYLDYNLITTPWLLVTELAFIFSLLVCLTVIGVALNRGRVAALTARKAGEGRPLSETQQAALNDPAPLVFAGIATLTVPLMALLEIAKPF